MSQRFTPPTNLAPYEAFIFDCDGTLADTMPAHFAAWQRALREGGTKFDFTWPLFVSRAGMSMENTVLELGKQFNQTLDSDFISLRQRQIFNELSEEMRPIVEVTEFARRVQKTHPVAVASGSSRKSVERTLRIIGVSDLFEVIVTPEDVAQGKPHPDSFLLAAERLGVTPSRCLVVEDAELGFEAARRAGMDFVAVDCPDPTQK